MDKLSKGSYVILGQLNKKDHSGYDLKMVMAKISSFYWSESNAQIYPILKKLEENKLVTSHVDAKSGARKKRIYSITAEGKKIAEEWLAQPCDITPYREEFLLKLSLCQFLSKKELLKHLEHYKKQLHHSLADHDIVIDHIDTDHAGRKDQFYLQQVHQQIHDIFETKLKWCENVIKKVKAKK